MTATTETRQHTALILLPLLPSRKNDGNKESAGQPQMLPLLPLLPLPV